MDSIFLQRVGVSTILSTVQRAYRDHVENLYRLAFGILRDRDAAVDATQVAFARAFERWAQYEASRPRLPWLHGIVAHEALDAVRRSWVRRIAVAAIADRDAASSRSPERDVATRWLSGSSRHSPPDPASLSSSGCAKRTPGPDRSMDNDPIE
jgi:DNA-directed RNA polymerase specialized sigma subunit, sigma24 homolog